MDEMTLFRDFGEKLLASPAPGAVTDYKQARLLEATTPNVLTHGHTWYQRWPNMLRMKENGAFLDVIRGKQPTENSLKNFDLLFLGFTEMVAIARFEDRGVPFGIVQFTCEIQGGIPQLARCLFRWLQGVRGGKRKYEAYIGKAPAGGGG